MPIIKRFNSLENLQDIDILFEETGATSTFFNITEFPDPLQVGKNSFLIDGSAKLANFTELKIDIIDSAGQSIYHEPVRGYLEGTMRRISIEVYDTNAPGSGFLTIVGEANPSEVDVPIDWQGVYNVRYIRPISINTTQINTQPIFFYKQPKIRGRELTKAFIDELPPSASYTITGSVTVTATTAGSEIEGESINDSEELSPAVTTTGENAAGKFLKTYKNKRENKISVVNQPTVLSLGTIQRRASPETPTHTITINELEESPENDAGKLTSAFVGGKILIRNPVVDESSFYIGDNDYITKPSTYATRIQEVINSTTLVPETPFVIEQHAQKQSGDKTGYKDPDFDANRVWSTTLPTGKSTGGTIEPSGVDPKQPDTPHTDETGAIYYWGEITSPTRIPDEGAAGGNETLKYYGWAESGSLEQSDREDATNLYSVSMLPNTNVTMSILPTPGKTLKDTYLRSYVDFSVVDMRTFSGDIFRMKVYGKLRGALTDFELLYDSPIESPQVLLDPFSVDGFTNVGYFYSGSIIDNYWASSSNGTVLQNDDYMVDGALISGSNYDLKEQVEFFTTSSYSLERNVQYSVGFDTHYIKSLKKVTIPPTQAEGGTFSTKDELKAELKVFLSGSKALDGTGDGGEDIYLGKVSIPSGHATLEGEQKGVFQTFLSARKHFPSAQLKFVATAGQWVIKDVDLKPSSETNFSPDYFRTIIPLPYIHKRPAMMDFLVEFYDVNNNIADSFAFYEKFRIIGAPQVIAQGDKNVLSGSMYLGNLQGQGIEVHGGSAFLRSIGYEGFEATISSGSGGFMIFSGSLDEGTRADGSGLLQTTESYDGVGLEIVDAHGAVNRYLKFRTNPSTFEVVTDQFFLGQSGKSFVSGSNGNLELFSSGNTTLSGSGVDILTPNFFLGGTSNFISGSGGNIEISSSNFNLQPDGDVIMQGTITAEAGGTIGGWTIDSNFISAPLTGHSDSTYSRIYLSTAADNDKNIGQGLQIYRKDEDVTAGNVKVIRVGQLSDTTNLHTTGSNDYGIQVIRQDSNNNYSNLIYIGKGEQMISGFNLENNALRKGTQFRISSSADTSDPVSFISSSNFKVSAGGDITGSAVHFTGGKIAGFTIQNEFISSSNLLINATDGELRTTNFVTGTKGWRITAGVYGGIDSNGTAEFENIRVRGTLRTAVFEKETVNAVGGQLWLANSTVLSSSVSASQEVLHVENSSGFEKDEIIFAKKVNGTGFTKEFMKVTSQSRVNAASDNNQSGYLHVIRGFGGQATASAYSNVTTITEPITSKTETLLTVADESPSDIDLKDSTIRIDSEIMQVTGSESNKLHVRRGTNGSAKATHSDNATVEKVDPDVAFLLGLVSPAEAYTEGQVLVSTGRHITGTGDNARGSGYMLLNANPGDATTPYMDFHERTGSGIYDSKLKTRVGDLSGLVATSIGDELFAGSTDPGFGMVSENIYLKGSIKAQSGSIGGLEMTPTKIFVGGVGTWKNSTSGFYVDNSGKFSLGDKFSWNGTKWEITGSEFSLVTTGTNKLQIESGNEVTPKIALGATLNPGPQGTNAGVFMDGTGSFLAYGDSGNYIKKYGTSLDIKSETFNLKTSTIHMSSSNGGVIAMGDTTTGIPETLAESGVFLSSSGEFNLQQEDNYIRATSGSGIAISYPSFSVNTQGHITAQSATIKGRIEAESGFFGSNESQGWNISANKIQSVVNDSSLTGSIEIDATPDSPNITITSASFVAELVPNFTPASTILTGGGHAFNQTDASGSLESNNTVNSNGLQLNNGETSSNLDLFAGMNGTNNTPVYASSNSVTKATLSANGNYKSKATVKIEVAVSTPNHDSGVGQGVNNYIMGGNIILNGTLHLRNSSHTSLGSANLGGTLIPTGTPTADVTIYSTTSVITVNHSVGGSDLDVYFHIDNLNVTNDNLVEDYALSYDPFRPAPTNPTYITHLASYFTLNSHEPSNKKTELAPSGLQSVYLQNSTIDNALNKYVRIAPSENGTFNVLGSTHLTGSVEIRDNASANSGYLRSTSGSEGTPSIQLGSTNDGMYHSTSPAGVGFVVNNDTVFLMADGGHFHADNDITGYSSTITSDRRLKESVKPLENNLNKVLELKPSTFKWKVRDKQDDIGFIAQEVEKTIPEIVNEVLSIGETAKFLKDDNHKTVDYAKLTTYLVGAIQEQQKQIDELKKTIDRMFI